MGIQFSIAECVGICVLGTILLALIGNSKFHQTPRYQTEGSDRPLQLKSLHQKTQQGIIKIQQLKNFVSKFLYQNPLHFDLFKEVNRLEKQTLSVLNQMFQGGFGTINTGPNQCVVNLLLTHRNISMKKGISSPNIIIPENSNACYNKAAHFFGLQIKTYSLLTHKTINGLADQNTILLVVLPCDPFSGQLWDLQAIKAINLPIHVDATLFGFYHHFNKNLCHSKPSFNISDHIVSLSISFQELGVSNCAALLHRTNDLRRQQFFCRVDWCGGLYATVGMQGSRTGCVPAGAFYALASKGRLLLQKWANDKDAKKQSLSNELKKKGIKIQHESKFPQLTISKELSQEGCVTEKWEGRGVVLRIM